MDAGGGPGRYTIELAKRSYDVVLMDLLLRCLGIAGREVAKAGVRDKVKAIAEGSVVNLSRFNNELFDATLCLGGSLSHLLEQTEREQAASELLRVTKEEAPLFISVINRYEVFRTVLQRLQEELTDPSHEEMFTKGIHRAHYQLPLSRNIKAGFTDAYFFLPNELRKLFESKGVQTITMATCQGLSSSLKEATNKLFKDKEKWRRWLQILLQTCTDPCILGLGEHFLYVGRKTARSV